MQIQLAHSPDPDDAFMFYAIAKGKIPLKNFFFIHILSDIESLNVAAFEKKYEITALSLHAYAYVSQHYWLLPNGASIGKKYGPIVVAKKNFSPSELAKLKVAIPGKFTTAALILQLAIGKINFQVIPFDRIISAIVSEKVDAGVLIHEGQLTYPDWGLAKILDLGEWWDEKTRLPLPLGVDVIRKNLGAEIAQELSEILYQSIQFGLEHEEEALDYALQFGRGLTREKGRDFVRMYVNERTLGYSPEDKIAVETLLEEGYKSGIIPLKPNVSFDFKN